MAPMAVGTAKDLSPSRQLVCDNVRALLFEQVVELENRDQHFVQAIDHLLHATHRVAPSAEIGPGFRPDAGHVELHEPGRHLPELRLSARR